MKKKLLISFISISVIATVVFVIFLVSVYIEHNKPFWETEQLLESTCNRLMTLDLDFGKHDLQEVDAWQNSIIYFKKDMGDSVLHTVQSFGPDHMSNSGDDIYFKRTTKGY